jgi:hypothetical protein
LINNKSLANYLKSLCKLVHYSEHSIADINDAAAKYHNVVQMALADGNVSSSELTEIINAGYDYFKSIRLAFEESKNIVVGHELMENSKNQNYADFFEEFNLEPPNENNINEWSKVIDGWSNVALTGLSFLRNSSLEKLLINEHEVRKSFINNTPILKEDFYDIKVSNEYHILTPGSERPRQNKMKLWDRFMSGEGLFGATAKFMVSIILIGGALFLGDYTQYGSLTIYNGLGINVVVDIDGVGEYQLGPDSFKTIEIDSDANYDIRTTTTNGALIERLDGKIGSSYQKFVYNIANAGVFFEYTAIYTSNGGAAPQNRNLGANRWFESKAEYILVDPPLSDDVGTKTDVLVAVGNIDPYDMLYIVSDSVDVKKMITTHVMWDTPESEYILTWMSLLAYTDNYKSTIDKRMQNYGDNMISQRALMDLATEDEKSKICEEINLSSQQNPEDADLHYLKTRCLGDSKYQDSTFVAGHEKWNDHPWLAYASAYTYAQNEEWEKSLNAFYVASSIKGLKGIMALDAEKVRRMANSSHKEGILKFSSLNLDYFLQIDHNLLNQSSGDANYVHVLISKGKLIDAYMFVQDYPQNVPFTLRFLAVSKGASEKIKNEARLLNEEDGLSFSSLWYSLAFDIIEKRDYESTITSIVEFGITAIDLNSFINASTTGDYTTAESIIKKQTLFIKGYLYSVGIIISNYEAPDLWKENANKLLFAHERPFLGN